MVRLWWTIFFVPCIKINDCERYDPKNKNYCYDWPRKQFAEKNPGTYKGRNGCGKAEFFARKT